MLLLQDLVWYQFWLLGQSLGKPRGKQRNFNYPCDSMNNNSEVSHFPLKDILFSLPQYTAKEEVFDDPLFWSQWFSTVLMAHKKFSPFVAISDFLEVTLTSHF